MGQHLPLPGDVDNIGIDYKCREFWDLPSVSWWNSVWSWRPKSQGGTSPEVPRPSSANVHTRRKISVPAPSEEAELLSLWLSVPFLASEDCSWHLLQQEGGSSVLTLPIQLSSGNHRHTQKQCFASSLGIPYPSQART